MYLTVVAGVLWVYYSISICWWHWLLVYFECILPSVVSDNGGWWVQMWDKRHSVGALFWSQARDLYHKSLLLKGVPNTKNSCKVRGVNRTESRNIEKVGLLCKFEQFCLFIFFSVHAKRQAPQRSWKMAWACSFGLLLWWGSKTKNSSMLTLLLLLVKILHHQPSLWPRRREAEIYIFWRSEIKVEQLDLGSCLAICNCAKICEIFQCWPKVRDGWSNRPLTIYRRVKYTQERILKITNPKPRKKYDLRIKVESNDGAVEGINLFDAQCCLSWQARSPGGKCSKSL